MITLTTEQAQQIEEALVNLCNSIQLPTSDVKALATIRAARTQEFTAEQQDRFATAFDEAFAKAGLPQKQAEQDPVACGCGATAYCLIRHTNLPEHNFTPICLSCLQEHEQNAQEVNEHEMNNFGGAYGLVTWETKPLYTSPVRTKDLTDDEIDMVLALVGSDAPFHAKYRAVISADREKNK